MGLCYIFFSFPISSLFSHFEILGDLFTQKAWEENDLVPESHKELAG